MAFLYIIEQPMHLMYTQHGGLLTCIICLNCGHNSYSVPFKLTSEQYIIHVSLLLAQVTTLFYTTSSMQYCSRKKSYNRTHRRSVTIPSYTLTSSF